MGRFSDRLSGLETHTVGVGIVGVGLDSVQEFYRAFSARIASLAKTQSLLTEDQRQLASLRDMLEHELHPFLENGRGRVLLDGPPVDLSADLAIPVGMALHELTTNSVRHGALSVPGGRVLVTWDVVMAEGSPRLHLEWRENGGPPVEKPRHRGFGSALLERVIAMRCNGDVRMAFARTGVQCTMEAPLAER
jgi:two-component sensor histidine kinase